VGIFIILIATVCTDSREIWNDVGPLLGHAKFHANWCTGVGMRLSKFENFHSLVESPRRGELLTDFTNVGAFNKMRPTTMH